MTTINSTDIADTDRGRSAAQVRPTWTSVGPPYPSGVNHTGWHAIERTVRTGDQARDGDQIHDGGEVHGATLCGQVATVVSRRGAFDRAHPRTCPACLWTVAIRAGTDTVLAQEMAQLRPTGIAERAEHTTRGLDPDLCPALAAAVLGAAGRSDGYELDHPRTVALLTTITTHRPTPIIGGDCAEQGCEHDERADGQGCPLVGIVCAACSLQSGGWAGEWEGRYEPECTVPAPCSVLTTLADHYGVPTGPIRTGPAGTTGPAAGSR